ncbi:phytoene desaturase family protein [Rapidithrix thailandica]|uniref:Phytoene desaturase family protein n=1 Tax=Rapidithrix thailandica TaxID=413964 RepID=A0AAW9RY88_9BACT
MTRVAIIGSGFSGLAASSCLAQAGFEVTVFEKNSSAGGRARKLEAQGFTFDMGPSWYWMPDVFDTFFKSFGKTSADYYDLVRLDPSYRIFFSKEEVLDVPAGMPALCQLFDELEPGSSKFLKRFLEEGKYKYETGMHNLVYKPGLSLSELLDARLMKGVLRLHVFQSVSAYIKKYFQDRRLVQLLEFPVLFLGAPPRQTPALYTLMNYADMALGTWYPMGGMHQVVKGMGDLAESLGVQFRFNSTVRQICMNGERAEGLLVDDTMQEFDYIVSGADYHHVEQKLLPAPYRRYSEKYWQSRTMAPSCLIFYLGIRKKLKNLLHHNLFFDQDFATHIDDIYQHPAWPANPLFYVCCPSQTDPSVAPEEHENLFLLIPVAPGLQDSPEVREKYLNLLIERMEVLTGQEIRSDIVFQKSYAHQDFTADYNAFKGNAYGLANTLRQTAHFKPSMLNPKVKNLYYTGQLTVPGPGVPPAIISGQVVARELLKRSGKQK